MLLRPSLPSVFHPGAVHGEQSFVSGDDGISGVSTSGSTDNSAWNRVCGGDSSPRRGLTPPWHASLELISQNLRSVSADTHRRSWLGHWHLQMMLFLSTQVFHPLGPHGSFFLHGSVDFIFCPEGQSCTCFHSIIDLTCRNHPLPIAKKPGAKEQVSRGDFCCQ